MTDEDFLEELYTLCAEKHHDSALHFAISHVDKILTSGQHDRFDRLLNLVDLERVHEPIPVAMLGAAVWVQSPITALREAFVAKLRSYIAPRHAEHDAIAEMEWS